MQTGLEHVEGAPPSSVEPPRPVAAPARPFARSFDRHDAPQHLLGPCRVPAAGSVAREHEAIGTARQQPVTDQPRLALGPVRIEGQEQITDARPAHVEGKGPHPITVEHQGFHARAAHPYPHLLPLGQGLAQQVEGRRTVGCIGNDHGANRIGDPRARYPPTP